MGVKAPLSGGGCAARGTDVTRVDDLVSPSACHTRKLWRGSAGPCFGRAQLVPDMAGRAQAGSGQGRGELAASPLARFTVCPRCPPAAASQQELIGTSDSFSRFLSPGSRHSLAGLVGMAAPGVFAHPANLDIGEEPQQAGVVVGCAAPAPHGSPLSTASEGTPASHVPPLVPGCAGQTQPHRGAQAADPPSPPPHAPHPATHKPQRSPMRTNSLLYLTRENSPKFI